MQPSFPVRQGAAWLSLLFLAAFATAALGDVPLSHQAWSTEEGLPDAGVHQVFQSRDGYLWLATEGGVARFDGSGFQVFRHETEPAFASNDIIAIAQDGSGALWFGTADGLVQSRGSVWRRFDERNGLDSSAILSLATAADGSLLVLTARSLFRFDGTAFQTLPSTDATFSSLQREPDGAIWLMGSEGIQKYEGGAVPHLMPASEIYGNPVGQEVIQDLQFGPGGVVWTRSSRSISVQARDYKRVLRMGRDLPAGRATALYVDRKGTAWIGTNRGLFSLGPDPKAAVERVDSLRMESILSVMEDREGNLWIGTETSGLHALRPRKFRSEPAAAGEAVTSGIVSSDGVQWFGTREDGVRRIRNGIAELPAFAASLTSPVILSIAHGNHGDIWIGTPDGLNKASDGAVQRYTSSNGLPDDFVRSVVVDSHGTAWAGTRRGLVQIDNRKTRTFTRADGLGSDSIGPLLESSSQTSSAKRPASSATELWIGTSSGLSHLRGDRIENFLPHPNEARNVVTAIAQENDGTIWIGLHGEGLSRFADGRFDSIHSSSLPAEIASLVTDHHGFLWLRGMRGVYRVSLAAVGACANVAAKCNLAVAEFGGPDGMPSDAMTIEGTSSVWTDAGGELYFATRKGIAVADPAHLPINLVPPAVVIQRFIVDEDDVPFGAADTQISAGHNRYTFEYAALSYTLPSGNRYRYMLDGFDHDWVDAGALRVASYTSLPPHRYRFRVQARNNDGVWNEAGAELRFHVLPPIYRRWWFYVLALLTAIGLAVVIFRLRLQVIRRRFAVVLNERNRMAREVHDTLAQDFVSVSLQLDIANQMLNNHKVDQAAAQLQATRKLVKEGLDAARQSIWNLRASAAGGGLPERLTALVNRYREQEHRPRLKIGGTFRKLADTIEGNVLRIAQESLANSYRHSSATEVLLHLHYDPDILRLSIVDNGSGFSLEEAGGMEGHYGLRGMQERAASLGGTLTIASSPENGTAVTLLLPLARKEDSPS